MSGQQSSSRRRGAHTADETDAYTRWRRILAWTYRPGTVKAVKRATHKRERRTARTEIRRDET